MLQSLERRAPVLAVLVVNIEDDDAGDCAGSNADVVARVTTKHLLDDDGVIRRAPSASGQLLGQTRPARAVSYGEDVPAPSNVG
jgi:hypothetical protein